MGSKPQRLRRWLGAVFLLTALGMLVAGETVLRPRLKDTVFVLYWMVCFVLTCLAILVAFLDASSIGRRAREEQREFLQDTLRDIAQKQKERADGKKSGRGD